jgi:signal transduction histidine kinase
MCAIDKDDHQNQSIGVASALQDVNAALWEFDLQTKQLKFSAGFYTLIGYEANDVEISYSHFINDILYHEDIPSLLKETNSCEPGRSKSLEIRLLTKQGFQWFQNTFRREKGSILTGSIINIHQFKIIEFQLAAKNSNYATVVKIAGSGSWEIDIKDQNLSLSKEAYHILEIPIQNNINITDLIRSFIPEHRPILTSSINSAIAIGKPFDLDLQIRTGTNAVIWVKIKGLTTIDEFGKGIYVKGVLQNIDRSKREVKELQDSYSFLEHQNKRLQTFAYMVSHNLRSHASNLQYLVKMHDESEEQDERKEIFTHITTISDSLNTTIQHLNEIVKIEADLKQERTRVEFEPLFKNVLSVLKSNIEQTEAVINYDFTECGAVNYIPAYLESIFQNFLTNSLKYRHPERQPIITCHSTLEDGTVYLIFEDNGIGIDLERYGHKVFGMYQTFHNNPDSKGIGLFITRNQVEALGGDIEIDSRVGIGTKFLVRLGPPTD